MDDLLIGYALDILTPADRAAVEAHLAAHPQDTAKVDRVRQALRPLEADRDGYDPPRGLAAAAVARTAEYLVAHGMSPVRAEPAVPLAVPSSLRRMRPEVEPIFPGWWRRADAVVAAGIALMAVGLAVAGIGRLRHDSQVVACQDKLRELHVALAGYADTHDGRYPEVGTPAVPVAGAFAAELARAGQYPSGRPAVCPAVPPTESVTATVDGEVTQVGYSYTLGYYGPRGQVLGLRQADIPGGASDWVPVAADLPAVWPAGGPGRVAPHPRGQNVLYAGGSVRFATTPAAGIDGDDIYHNDAGLVRAGLHRNDASLGRPSDYP